MATTKSEKKFRTTAERDDLAKQMADLLGMTSARPTCSVRDCKAQRNLVSGICKPHREQLLKNKAAREQKRLDDEIKELSASELIGGWS